MYLLDTNVISELRRHDRIDPCVAAWVRGVQQNELHLSAMTVFELELGVAMLERRDPKAAVPLRLWLDGKVLPLFTGRIFPVDAVVARRAAVLHSPIRRPWRDAFIAATAIVHGLTVVTRNVCDFQPMGVTLINPWQTAKQ